MKLFDETILTAYLDGELDEPRRRQVEAALALSPRLAARLGELSRTRDLVAGLRRPKAPAGLADGVVAELRARRGPGRRRLALRLDGPRATALNALAALAAAVVVAVTLAPWRRPAPAPRPVVVRPAPSTILAHEAARKPEAQPPDLRPGLRALGRWVVAVATRAAQATAAQNEAERLLRRQRQALEGMLGRRVAWYTVAADPARFDADLERLRGLVESTRLTRPARARLEFEDGPAGRAIAFAMVMRPAERDRFAEALRAGFDGVAEDRPPETLLARLAEPSRLDLHDGPAMSPVPPDPDFRHAAGAGAAVAAKQDAPEPPDRVPATAAVGPEADPGLDALDAPAAAPPADDATTVLVWLTAPPKSPDQRASK